MTIQYQSPVGSPIESRVKVAVVLFFCSIALYAASYLLPHPTLGSGQWMSCRPVPEYLVIQWYEGADIGNKNPNRLNDNFSISFLNFAILTDVAQPAPAYVLENHREVHLPYWPIILYFGVHAWPWIKAQRWLHLNQFGALLDRPALVGISTILLFVLFVLDVISHVHPLTHSTTMITPGFGARFAIRSSGFGLRFEKIDWSHLSPLAKSIRGSRPLFHLQLLGNGISVVQCGSTLSTNASVSISFLMLLTAIPLIVSIRLRRMQASRVLPNF